MATTVVYPSLDVSGTGSISTIISTAGTFTGSLTASSLTVTGTATFSGTAVFLTTAQFLGTVTFSASVRFLTAVDVSGTLSVGNLNVAGNLGFTLTVSFAGVANFGTSVSFSADVRMLGTLAVSGTLSTSILTIAGGFPVAWCKLGSANGATSTQFKISGNWTQFDSLQLVANGKGNALTTNVILFLYTDGGTTPLMTYATVAAATATASDFVAVFDIFGVNVSGLKVVKPLVQHFAGVTTQGAQTQSATTTTAALNCIGITAGTTTTTRTMSAASIYLYGRLL